MPAIVTRNPPAISVRSRRRRASRSRASEETRMPTRGSGEDDARLDRAVVVLGLQEDGDHKRYAHQQSHCRFCVTSPGWRCGSWNISMDSSGSRPARSRARM